MSLDKIKRVDNQILDKEDLCSRYIENNIKNSNYLFIKCNYCQGIL